MREVEQLSDEQLCGQLLVVGFDGTELPPALRDKFADKCLGGVILFRRNIKELKELWRFCRRLGAVCEESFPPFIGIDQEGGQVRRLREGVLQLPPMRAFGRLDDLEFSKQVAAAVATELLSLGLNINFAPVCDVDSNPDNPIIGDRSFGVSPQLVTRHARVFIEGFQEQGLMACIKHFPGHGDTQTDSHTELPRVDRNSTSLREIELYPFERLARGAAAAMSAHVVYRAFDEHPATFSPRLCTTLLRREFGFEGVLFSDDLEMGAISPRWSIEESAPLAIEAGCDALLVCQSQELQERAHRALVARVREDAQFRARCHQAVERSLTQRRKFPSKPLAQFEAVTERLASNARLRKQLSALGKNSGRA
jgi:beta-N-acetylhexosaminidase